MTIFRTLPDITHKVYLEVEIDGTNVGRIILGLFGKVTPKTVENFRSLCACDNQDKTLCYKGSVFHRIIPNFMIQGGDIIRGDGTGGKSIYTPHNGNGNEDGTFKDENFDIKFNRKYLLAMANSGKPNTNASQFFITTVKTQWLTGSHVVFGMVMEESYKVVKAIEKEGTNAGIPRAKKIVIIDSGELSLSERTSKKEDDQQQQQQQDEQEEEGGDDGEDGEEETE